MAAIDPSLVRFTEQVSAGASWSHVLKRGTTLRVKSLGGGANVSALFYNFEILGERLNLPDTLKCQHTARLTAGHCLYSDMGRILVSITEDTCGWHDPLSGCSNEEEVLLKYGMDERDLAMNVNLFAKVTADKEGRLRFHEGHSKAGMHVDLRAEMNTLVVLNTCVHPLDPSPTYAPQPVELSVWTSPPPAGDDLCRTSCAENTRGFEITRRYFL